MPKSKIGEHCITNKDCVNDNCVDGKCTRKERTRKNKPKTPSPVKKNTIKKKNNDIESIKETYKKSYDKDDTFFNDRMNITKKNSPKQFKVITTEDSKKLEVAKKIPKKKIIIHIEESKTIENTNDNGPICKKFTKVDKIEEFKKNGMSVLQKCSKDELRAMVEEANKAFHCTGNPLMSDAEYDILYDYLKTKDNTISDTVGAPIVKNKVKLPYEMWSMDKIKPDTNILTTWKQKYNGPYVISCKLDGVSGMYSTEGSEPKLYTRGDGKVGQDISHMIPYLRLPKTKGLVMRGEFIILEDKFKHDYKEKFSNSRNLVAGIVNKKKSKDTLEIYKDTDFVAYELIKHPDHETILPSQQMELLSSMDLEVVKYEVHENIDNDMLSGILKDWRTNYKYTIDGIIVCDDKVYQRTSSNPKHAFAFKMVLSDQVAEAHVVDVLWSPSKDGYLKPRVEITPVYLGGVKITYATGFNAQFIESNKIGIGAIITLVRSGDVIPYIQSVNEPASEPKMPNEPYVWNSTHVDIMLENKSDNETVLEKNITGFFKGLEVEALGAGNVKKLISGGFNSIEKIIKMSIEDFLSIDGFKKKMAEKIHNSIKEKLEKATIVQIAAHCNIFGRGFSEKKLEVIFNAHSDILTNPVSVETLAKVKQIEKKTAQAFLEHVDEFKEFLAATNLTHKMDASEEPVSTHHILYDKNIVFTGFRNKELEAKLKAIGAKVTTSVNKKTHVLLVKSKDDESSKIEEAKKLQIEIITLDEFIAKYDM